MRRHAISLIAALTLLPANFANAQSSNHEDLARRVAALEAQNRALVADVGRLSNEVTTTRSLLAYLEARVDNQFASKIYVDVAINRVEFAQESLANDVHAVRVALRALRKQVTRMQVGLARLG